MKKFKIVLHNGDIYEVEGKFICPGNETTPSAIFIDDDPCNTNIVALIPKDAFVVVLPESIKNESTKF